MRTNEELAILAKERDKGAMTELWEQVYWLIRKLLGKYYPLCARYGVEPEDLTQSAYFALVRAVDDYNPDKGWLFSTYLTFHVGNTAREAFGFKQSRRIPPPFVQSLDEPLPGSEDASFTLGDTIEDDNAAAMFEQIQDDWQRAQLRACLDNCMCTMPPDQADTLRARYYSGKTLQAIADDVGTNREQIRQLEAKALRYMRKPRNSLQLKPFLYEFIQAQAYKGTGLQSFRDRQASSVEIIFECMDAYEMNRSTS